jgi:hypothetical protein
MKLFMSVMFFVTSFLSCFAFAGICMSMDDCGYGGTCVIDGFNHERIGYCIYSSEGGGGCKSNAECFDGYVCNYQMQCVPGPYSLSAGHSHVTCGNSTLPLSCRDACVSSANNCRAKGKTPQNFIKCGPQTSVNRSALFIGAFDCL